VRAMPRVAETLRGATLVLAGQRRVAGHARMDPAWQRTLGFVSDDDLVSLYRSARALIAPSSYEGFGLPMLEAMQLGTPVISARASSLPEVGGDAAAYVDPDDDAALARVIRRVLDEDSLHAEMRAAGLAQSARFSWDETARQTLAAFDDAIADDQRGRRG
jgi:glycosyltransferase involved in cell wall biosynthesis